ncbi:protein TolR [Candidatus Williamhamiltonella defendens]|uniref:Protein TolR n=2 Tax=Candidatus Williamhamiltonella defendens TaxID=138072 RepID=A0A2D3T5L9_9ENTR|nr:colicin uptake protein TolR [Candidatus Hamiltonella defensa]ACQ66937.1 tol protein R [Candidatus Hamiltonella defensa 5AT (Acyrthosiphon pisum)]ASV32908.1 protein TolR [Candidatus Hamiltonella defensa]ATW21736.1 protein TolR [Candidatus Hamiltonella defensa]ATW29108.1 protein TolR [Candidatus Hamiltonella defensa]ATW31087.1 protein TolR [Candidatus Hamiltonella defensa]
MRIRGRHRRELKPEINMVPLLDVLLVLLLIFMATAPIITQSVEVNLPETSHSKMVDGNHSPVIIEVSGTGQYAMIIDHKRMEALSEQQLISEAKMQLKNNSKAIFLIGGAKEVAYDEIMKVLNMLHQTGVTSVGLMTQTI